MTEGSPIQGRAKGGVARAKSLTKSERSLIARNAAAARWAEDELPRAVASSGDTPLLIGDREIDCYVLEDGTRVLSQRGFLGALGRNPRVNMRNAEIPFMLRGAAFEPLLTTEVLEAAQPIVFRGPNGVRTHGYRAELLTLVCDLYQEAEPHLAPNQRPIAEQAKKLTRALAFVGIVALVDEATHYQEVRAKNSLTAILEAFVAKDIRPWVKTFPNDFYKELFRLRGLAYPEDTPQRPPYFGLITNNIVYDRLAPGVLEELRKVTPRNDEGRPTRKYHQSLTREIGHPNLVSHLGSVVTLMKLSKDWHEFLAFLDRIHPRWNTTIPMDLEIYEQQHGL